MLYFLLVVGRAVSGKVSRLLYRVAKDMAKSRNKSKRFNEAGCEGILTTGWKSGNMGTISGTEFKAEMIVDAKEITATFLVRSYDLEDEDYVPMAFGSLEDAEQYAAKLEKPARLN